MSPLGHSVSTSFVFFFFISLFILNISYYWFIFLPKVLRASWVREHITSNRQQEGETSCLAFVSGCPAVVVWEQAGY